MPTRTVFASTILAIAALVCGCQFSIRGADAAGNDTPPQYCLVDENGGCTRSDLRCIDCGAKVCGPSSFCDAC